MLRRREPLIRKARSIPQLIKTLLLQHGVAAPDGLARWEHPEHRGTESQEAMGAAILRSG